MKWPDLTEVLRGVPWAVCGAVATRLYMPERATAHLNIVIAQGDRREAARLLGTAGFVQGGDLAIGGSVWQSPDGTEVDVLERTDPWISEALNLARANRDSQGLPVLPLPYLVLMKLQASRVQDLADASRMLGAPEPDALEDVRQVIGRYAPEDSSDLESLIELGKLEQAAAED